MKLEITFSAEQTKPVDCEIKIKEKMKKKPSWGSCKNSNQNEFELYD
jgi:hypothetical protein